MRELEEIIILILKITNNILYLLLVPSCLFGFIIILEVDVIGNIPSALKRSIMRLRAVK